MKKHFDLYTKFILSLIAVCLITVVLMNLKIVPKAFADEDQANKNKKDIIVKSKQTEIGWCDVKEEDLSVDEYHHLKNFVCPDGYFVIGFTFQKTGGVGYIFPNGDGGEVIYATNIEKVKYAKPCIKN